MGGRAGDSERLVGAVGRGQVLRQKQWSGFSGRVGQCETWAFVHCVFSECLQGVHSVFAGYNLQAEFQLLLRLLVCAKNIQFFFLAAISALFFLNFLSQSRENRRGREKKW